MLTIRGKSEGTFGDRCSRRAFLQAGTLGIGGLTLADLMRLRASGGQSPQASGKSVIMIYLCGAPPHMDMYDMKPEAPVEYRGEFAPIPTNVPGFDLCELMPMQATIADKLAVVRNMRVLATNTHMPEELLSGFPLGPQGGPASLKPGVRPTFGSVVSKLQRENGSYLPQYVQLGMEKMPHGYQRSLGLEPAFLGIGHQPFNPTSPDALQLNKDLTLGRLEDRLALRGAFDELQHDLGKASDSFVGMDEMSAQAYELLSSDGVRDAFDVSKEPEKVRQRYGTSLSRFLQARRLVEAGVSVVTVLAPGYWDTHSNNFSTMRKLLPLLDKGIHALVSDLYERGLDEDVAVVVWGEYGRTPRVNSKAGRDHWPQASFALVAGGGFQMGQVVGATTDKAEQPLGGSYIPQNLLATLYREIFGIDPATTLRDHRGRPIYLLDERDPISELI